jgi:hypothetical protein
VSSYYNPSGLLTGGSSGNMGTLLAMIDDLSRAEADYEVQRKELASLTEAPGLHWVGLGFNPLARQDDLDWVPKSRYPIMRSYLPTRGTRGLDMMRRTATVQANFDFTSERDAMRKLRVIIVASAPDQVICGESTSKAPAIMEKRGAGDALRARVPRAIARDGGSVRESPAARAVRRLHTSCGNANLPALPPGAPPFSFLRALP